jgi:DNA-binding transcriptional LysR family regulator
VTVSATDGMASHWLKPLVDSFRADHPEVGFVILASDEDDTLRNYAEVDLALLCGNERCEVGETLHFLFNEVAVPVCSPAYMEAHGPFPDARSLNRANLLHLHERHWTSSAIDWRPLGWEEWFRAQGAPWGKEPSSLASNKVSVLTDAALAGEGVMLGWEHMALRQLEEGRLVKAHPSSVTTGRGNFLKCQSASLTRPPVARFVEHLLASLGRTLPDERISSRER